MNIFQSLFGTSAAAPTPPATPAPGAMGNAGAQLQGTGGGQNTAPNGMIPANVPAPAPEPAPAPLDAFKDIWNAAPAAPSQDLNAPIFDKLDPTKLFESARQINFGQAVTPEMMQKITAGGPEAAQAFAEAMNKVAQQVYAQSALVTTKIVEQGLQTQGTRMQTQLPNLVKRDVVANGLRENALLQNPAIQPLVGALQEQLIRKNPNAAPGEIQQQIEAYFGQLGSAFAPKPVEAQSTQQSRDADWEKFFQQ